MDSEDCGCEPAEMALELQAVLAAVTHMAGGTVVVPSDVMLLVAGMKFSLDLEDDGSAVVRVKRAPLDLTAGLSLQELMAHEAPKVLQ
jgi:hypothetical protein